MRVVQDAILLLRIRWVAWRKKRAMWRVTVLCLKENFLTEKRRELDRHFLSGPDS